MKADDKVRVIFADVLWRCSDCDNLYTMDIKHCPNEVLDGWIIMKVTTVEELKGWA